MSGDVEAAGERLGRITPIRTKKDGPRTKAGMRLIRDMGETLSTSRGRRIAAYTLAIEAEAAALDVEVLARAIWHHYHEAEDGLYDDASEAYRLSVRDFAREVAAEYARLESASGNPSET